MRVGGEWKRERNQANNLGDFFILLQDYNIIFSSIIGSMLPKHILNLRIPMLFGGNVHTTTKMRRELRLKNMSG